MTTLYVGNLPFSATEAEIRSLFEQHGQVESVKIINDVRPAVRAASASWTCRPTMPEGRRGLERRADERSSVAGQRGARAAPRGPRSGPPGGGERW